MVNTTSPEQVTSHRAWGKCLVETDVALVSSRRLVKEDKPHFELYSTVTLFFFDIITVKW